MIYDVNSPLFRSFLSQKGGSSDKRFSPPLFLSCQSLGKSDEQKPKEQKPKASENKPIMTE
ncbi:Wound-induced basic protein [Glycine soja]|uniref:Wound-induced basic protein n=2 Tax=Glycine subgen. Soja TaxID=1462606 RepID=I1KZ37_SOYBN|nr:Wound-induced basic protein [Glycine soja]RZC00251.1 Wound-induced basic protein [Glycine soja]